MSKLKKPIGIATTFDEYQLAEQIGEGGAGRVYGGTDSSGKGVAVKLLTAATTDKRKRFKNEIAFLTKHQHVNIVEVTDYGISSDAAFLGPFYVMKRYERSLRATIEAGVKPGDVLPIYCGILDGVEAAHLFGATHRDIKPENVLVDAKGVPAVADFGIASFTKDILHTLVETKPATRLANFEYAAPEQRSRGKQVGKTADIYALGLMLNEMFTGTVPHGTNYKSIESVSKDLAFLDAIVAAMISQDPAKRPQDIAAVKALIEKYRSEAVTQQKLTAARNAVVPEGEVTDPLAFEPPKVVGANWEAGTLTLTLDRPVNDEWQAALLNMGSFSSVLGVHPNAFIIRGNIARVSVPDYEAQPVIDHFKDWLPKTTAVLKYTLEAQAAQKKRERLEQLRLTREAEERKLKVNQNLKI